MLERVVSSFAGVVGFEEFSRLPFGGELPDGLRPNVNAFPVDFNENFEAPFGGTAGGWALLFGYSVLALGSEEDVETALRCEELSVVETVLELEVSLPLHGSQRLRGRSYGGE